MTRSKLDTCESRIAGERVYLDERARIISRRLDRSFQRVGLLARLQEEVRALESMVTVIEAVITSKSGRG